MMFSGSNDPFGDPEEAAAVDQLLTAVALVELDDRSSTGDWSVVTAPDVIDGEEAEMVRDAFSVDRDLILDLSETTLLTANGSRALFDLHHRQRLTGHVLALKGAVGIVRQVIEITGLDREVLIIPGR
jgi:anti-anti-sigma regulatory factor